MSKKPPAKESDSSVEEVEAMKAKAIPKAGTTLPHDPVPEHGQAPGGAPRQSPMKQTSKSGRPVDKYNAQAIQKQPLVDPRHFSSPTSPM